MRELPSVVTDIKAVKSDLQTTEESIRNLTLALAQAMDTAASGYIIKEITELDKKKNSLELSIRKAEVHMQAERDAAATRKDVYNSICYLLDNFDDISYTGKNELIKKIVKTCILDTETKRLRIVF